MVKIKIIRDTAISGSPVFAGETYEVDETDARILVGYRKAEYIEAEPPKSKPSPKSKPRIISKPKK